MLGQQQLRQIRENNLKMIYGSKNEQIFLKTLNLITIFKFITQCHFRITNNNLQEFLNTFEKENDF